MKRHHRGFTVVEMTVVVGIILILMSLIWPSIMAVRSKARKAQCANNLTQIYHGIAMYSLDNGREGERFPAYMTNLNFASDGAYISDDRVFVCPMDPTKATQNAAGKTVLKPGNPSDSKADWAERVVNGLGQRNCSYLYEFSGRIAETYTSNGDGTGSWNYDLSDFGDTYLVDPVSQTPGPDPVAVARDPVDMNDGMGSLGITWADMKFYQLNWGDIYIVGYEDSSSGDFPVPPPGFLTPDGSSDGDPVNYYSYLYYTYPDTFDYDQIVCNYSRSQIPVARCFWHVNPGQIDSEAIEDVQNVGLDGNIFSSAPYWERTAYKYGPKTGYDPNYYSP